MNIIRSVNIQPHTISHPNIKEQICGDISHELRTPLTVIQVALDILSSGKLGDLSQQELRMVDIATNNVERLLRLAYAIEQAPETQTTFLSGDQIAQLRLERDLKKALVRNELTLWYQPIVSLQRYEILGFEALLRWHHPNSGMIFPDQFIPLAEKSELICEIGTWVLQTACYQLRTWQEQFPGDYDHLTISVNVSSKQLANPDLVLQVQQILQTTGLKPCNLVVEITETAMMENALTAKKTLEQLQRLGVRIYIDDFGTGYSSLSRLYELPLNVLKIDRSFVQKLDSPSGKQIVQAIANLAKNLGLEVIAEGVETVEQFLKLQLLGCDHGQGYFFAKPLEISAANELLNNFKIH